MTSRSTQAAFNPNLRERERRIFAQVSFKGTFFFSFSLKLFSTQGHTMGNFFPTFFESILWFKRFFFLKKNRAHLKLSSPFSRTRKISMILIWQIFHSFRNFFLFGGIRLPYLPRVQIWKRKPKIKKERWYLFLERCRLHSGFKIIDMSSNVLYGSCCPCPFFACYPPLIFRLPRSEKHSSEQSLRSLLMRK